MSFKIDPRIQTAVRVGEVAAKAAARVAPAPLRPLLQVGATGFEAARRVLVNLEGGVPSTTGGGAPAESGLNYLRVTTRQGLNLRSGPSAEGRLLGSWGAGTEFEIVRPQPSEAGSGWVYVRDPAGREGYIYAEGTTEPTNGARMGPPYVQPESGEQPARDGRPETALRWAESWIGDAESSQFQDFCLKFVMKAYGAYELPSRSPELSNPGASVTGEEILAAARQLQPGVEEPIVYRDPETGTVATGTAFGSYLAFQESGKMNAMPEDPAEMPGGAIVFFAPSEKNKGAGHVALLTWVDGEPYVVTSGWTSSREGAGRVQLIPLSEMEAITGPAIGYVNPQDAVDENTLSRPWLANPG